MDKQIGKGAFGVVRVAKPRRPPHQAVAVKSISKAKLVSEPCARSVPVLQRLV